MQTFTQTPHKHYKNKYDHGRIDRSDQRRHRHIRTYMRTHTYKHINTHETKHISMWIYTHMQLEKVRIHHPSSMNPILTSWAMIVLASLRARIIGARPHDEAFQRMHLNYGVQIWPGCITFFTELNPYWNICSIKILMHIVQCWKIFWFNGNKI